MVKVEGINPEEELRKRRLQRWKLYEQYQASVDNASSGHFGQMNGRTFTPIAAESTTASEVFKSHVERPFEDQLHNNRVNTAKKSPHS